jgi:hypothetical protein
MSAQPRWDHTEGMSRPRMASVATTGSERAAAIVLTAIGLASIAVGAIHISAADTLGNGSAQNAAFFGLAAAAEIIWGAVALVRARRWWLVLGLVGHLAVVATYVVSRTVGLPVGVYAHVKLPVGWADGLATALGALIVIGAGWLLLQDRVPARAATRSLGATAAIVVLVGALALSGVIWQQNAFGSSGGSSNGGGGASISNGYGGYGGSSGSTGSSGTTGSTGSTGGMTSGGGYSGAGY